MKRSFIRVLLLILPTMLMVWITVPAPPTVREMPTMLMPVVVVVWIRPS